MAGPYISAGGISNSRAAAFFPSFRNLDSCSQHGISMSLALLTDEELSFKSSRSGSIAIGSRRVCHEWQEAAGRSATGCLAFHQSMS